MKHMLIILIMSIVTILFSQAGAQPPVPEIQRYDREPGFKHPVFTEPYTPKQFKPRQYVVYRTVDDIIIDGQIEESSWDNADWTERFGHIMFKGYREANRGSSMRMNFSRVQSVIHDEWPIDTWKHVSSVDWLWSPMLTYRAHVTECFGRVIMSDKTVIQYRDEEMEHAFPFVDAPKAPKKTKQGSMVKFKSGTYTIGPDDDDPSGASPKGEVTVNSFYMDCHEVTIGEYVRFLNAGAHDEFYYEDMADPDWCGIIQQENGQYNIVPGKKNYPVVLVAVEGAKAYAAWAGKRLPTEYEWEIAARGGTERLYPWGDEAPDITRTNYDYHIGHSVPVGSYPAGRTPEGLYDMAGNVNEIIDRKWEEYPWGTKRIDKQKPCTLPLCRGGAWTAQPLKLKATHRDVRKHFYKSPFTGFRCAKDAK